MTDLSSITQELEHHFAETNFQGIDPHDGLNSPLVKALTFGDRRLGIAALQFFKRCPVNLRPLFGIRPGINPKGHGLLVATYVQKYRMTGETADLARAKEFADWLIENQSPGCSGAAWGYNFDWPNRNAIFPAGTPTSVNTAYIAEALLDLFEVTGDEKYKVTAVSSADFLLKDLNRSSDTGHEFCFSYTPRDQTQIHNANMLGATLLARIYKILTTPAGDGGPTEEFVGRVSSPGGIEVERIRQAAQASMRFSINRQQPDGSWLYGTEPRNSWIDSYHTGYNLLAIKRYMQAFSVTDYELQLRAGYSFYLDHFFTPEGFVKYYHDRTYPWDGHAMAHALLTLDELEYLEPERTCAIREKVIARIQDTFWDERRGCFIYLISKHWKNRIDYYRWVGCWMFYALMKHLLKAGGCQASRRRIRLVKSV
jgi:hypothetical protein